MSSKPLLTVLLPAYREADNLRELLPRLQDALGALAAIPFEVLVVDARESTDDTAAVCAQFGARRQPRRRRSIWARHPHRHFRVTG